MEDVEANFRNSTSGDDDINCDNGRNVENDAHRETHRETDRNADTAIPAVRLEAILPDQSLNQSTIITSEDIHHKEIYRHRNDSRLESSNSLTMAEELGITENIFVESKEDDDSAHVITNGCSRSSDTIEVTACDNDESEENDGCAPDSLPNVAEARDSIYSQSNPFNEDDLDDETPALMLNPFNDDDESYDDTIIATDGIASMNPFGDDSIESSPRRESTKEQLKQSIHREHQSPLNPFGDGDTEDVEKVHTKNVFRQITEVTTSASSAVPTAQMNKTQAKPASETQCAIPQRTFSKEYNELITLGFDKICAGQALQKTSGDLPTARKMLMSRLTDNRAISNEEIYVWKSPVMIRVGGWLPNVQDESGAIHTSYFINVTMTLGNESWRIGHRYSEFYSLYSSIYSQLCKAFPSGMHDMFPTDRLSNWLSSKNQETINDKRRKALDSWLREVCNSPNMMLDEPTRKAVYHFFQVDENMAARNKSSSQRAGSAANMEIPTDCPPPAKATIPLFKSLSRRLQSSATPAAQDSSNRSAETSRSNPANVESTDFDNRKRAALAAQRNDYSSAPSQRELRLQSNETEVHLESSEPSSSGFSDARSKSFARRVNQQN